MTTTITIESNILKAHLITAAKNDTRYYLNGIFIDVKNCRIVSTDGHCLLVTRLNENCIDGDVCEPFIINRDVVALGLKACVKKMPAVITYDQSPNTVPVLTVCDVTGSPVHGKFPDFERLIPSSLNNQMAHFDAELVNRVSDALILLNGKQNTKPTLFHNGKNVGLMICGNDSFGVVMPMRDPTTQSDALILVDAIMGRTPICQTTAA